MVRRVIFNSDDYGLCFEVNAAVEELIEAGRLRDVSVLANGARWESAANFLLAHPQISPGIHLNAIEGKPVASGTEARWLTGANGEFIGLRGLMLRWVRHPLAVTRAVELEWRAQFERLRAAGLSLSHVDSHQHLHAFPPAWRCAINLCRKFNVQALRLPLEKNGLPLRRAGALALGASLAVANQMASSKGLRHNDHFLGFKRAGAYGLDELLGDLREAAPGVTEVALHPSLQNQSPYPSLFGNRERLALLDASFPDRLSAMGIEVATWKEVAQ